MSTGHLQCIWYWLWQSTVFPKIGNAAQKCLKYTCIGTPILLGKYGNRWYENNFLSISTILSTWKLCKKAGRRWPLRSPSLGMSALILLIEKKASHVRPTHAHNTFVHVSIYMHAICLSWKYQGCGKPDTSQSKYTILLLIQTSKKGKIYVSYLWIHECEKLLLNSIYIIVKTFHFISMFISISGHMQGELHGKWKRYFF